MEKNYWIGRKRAAMAMARAASSAEARLIHYDLAGRYSIMAAQSVATASAGDGRVALQMPARIEPPIWGDMPAQDLRR